METNNVITFDETIEDAVNENVKAGNGSFKIINAIGIGVIVGAITIATYKYIAKPAIINFKNKRNAKCNIAERMSKRLENKMVG